MNTKQSFITWYHRKIQKMGILSTLSSQRLARCVMYFLKYSFYTKPLKFTEPAQKVSQPLDTNVDQEVHHNNQLLGHHHVLQFSLNAVNFLDFKNIKSSSRVVSIEVGHWKL